MKKYEAILKLADIIKNSILPPMRSGSLYMSAFAFVATIFLLSARELKQESDSHLSTFSDSEQIQAQLDDAELKQSKIVDGIEKLRPLQQDMTERKKRLEEIVSKLKNVSPEDADILRRYQIENPDESKDIRDLPATITSAEETLKSLDETLERMKALQNMEPNLARNIAAGKSLLATRQESQILAKKIDRLVDFIFIVLGTIAGGFFLREAGISNAERLAPSIALRAASLKIANVNEDTIALIRQAKKECRQTNPFNLFGEFFLERNLSEPQKELIGMIADEWSNTELSQTDETGI